MAMTKAQRNERERQKRLEWKAEVARLHGMRDEKETLERDRELRRASVVLESQRDAELLAKVHEKLRSLEFKAWYEATTGEDMNGFLRDVLISPHEYLERFRGCKLHMTQLDWTKNAVEMIALKNPWKNPEMKQHWHALVQGTTEPRERRAVLIRLATPKWANQDQIVAIYRERDRTSVETGVPHEVDHIVPIVSKVVCGLHCEFNLRVIPESENRAKSNKSGDAF